MKWVYRIFRAVVVTAFLLGLVVPAVLYIFLTLPPVQNSIKRTAQTELSALLGVDVAIGQLDFSPFNRLTLHDVILTNNPSDTIASIGTLGAGISLLQAMEGNIVVTFAEVIELDGRIWRKDAGSPLNIQPIIDALSPKDPNKPPTRFDLKINTVVIRNSSLSYDVADVPAPEPGRFSPEHIAISGLRADISLPRIANEDFSADILQLAFNERSGLSLRQLTGTYHLTDTLFTASQPVIKVNNSTLHLADLSIPYRSLKTIGKDITESEFELGILTGSRIVPSDFSPLLQPLVGLDTPLNLTANISGRIPSIEVGYIEVSTPDNSLAADVRGRLEGLTRGPLEAVASRVAVSATSATIADIAGRFTNMKPALSELIDRLGHVAIEGEGKYTASASTFTGNLETGAGKIGLSGEIRGKLPTATVKGHIETTDLDIGRLSGREDLGLASIDAAIEAMLDRGIRSGRFDGSVPRLDYRGHSFSDISANLDYDGTCCRGNVRVDDPQMTVDLNGEITPGEEMPVLDLDLEASRVNLSLLGILPKYPDHRLSVKATASLKGRNADDAVGKLDIPILSFVGPDDQGLNLTDISVTTDNASTPQFFDIRSQLVDGRIEGKYLVSKIPFHAKDILSMVFPALVKPSEKKTEAESDENFTYCFTLKPDEERLAPFVKIPVDIVEAVEIAGEMDCSSHTLSANLVAPYIIKGGTMLQNTTVNAHVDGDDDSASFYFTTDALVKADNISLSIVGNGGSDRLDTEISWNYNRAKRYDGNINLTSSFSRNPEGKLVSRFDINPGHIAVNDTIWHINQASVTLAPGNNIKVDNIEVKRPGQHVIIDGSVSESPLSQLVIDLNNVNLDYIFDTLAIDNVWFGGDATGVFTASGLLSGEPRLSTDRLSVKGLAYNHSLMGDAVIQSSWLNSSRAVTIKADIAQPNGLHSYVDGNIKPMVDSLDFRFDANRINVGFMKPIMAAFADDVSGYASGKAHLYGSFKYVDMTGDIFAEDLKLKIGFTGTEYSTTDSIHLTPGNINFKDVVLTDIYGNHAMLNGWLKHEFFKSPRFEFVVSDAKDLLVYDKPGNPLSDLWYGRVFGDGSARVYGEPGVVDIGVNISTAPKSTFTFVISDNQVADEYTFIMFRDRNPKVIPEEERQPERVQEFLRKRMQSSTDTPSAYNMDIQVAVNPQAEVILVMDPIGGDRIRSRGEGDLRLTYNSTSEDLKMYGKYTLERGSYNFTLQDIIIKDFSIDAGSAITFNGDPYAAQLDIKAEYVVNANLSDLDESFLYDQDLNRTKVPVHALMFITGDMRQPDIAFDLSFPTMNNDVYRKVKSIISTEDMMNRQIVYLLALNRFYTPEYMSSTTKGNELVSVASSTISSQIGNMLGKISDNWSIAPALRSDRGDFRDVEFDVALSSTLLNNRLLLNGNFGYRDKALNNNSFIGDFDIEYLLNRPGTLRLKAYNRYNDQNYYIKHALTTQGVGIQFRHDFDNIFSFLKPLFGHKPDSIPAEKSK